MSCWPYDISEEEREAYYLREEEERVERILNTFCSKAKLYIARQAEEGKAFAVDGERVVKGCYKSNW